VKLKVAAFLSILWSVIYHFYINKSSLHCFNFMTKKQRNDFSQSKWDFFTNYLSRWGHNAILKKKTMQGQTICLGMIVVKAFITA